MMFQSLIGILMNCNLIQGWINERNVSIPNRDFDELQSYVCKYSWYWLPLVSIPNRDFDELQFSAPELIFVIIVVSIPNRDFDELQLESETLMRFGKMFQSLIGILMNCNCI